VNEAQIETIAEITVRVIDRRAGFAKIIDVTIGTLCPTCGGRRGTPARGNLYSSTDGTWRNVDSWQNPCGHTDMYAAVIAEAERLAAVRSLLGGHRG
jgi:hypothetical protein